MGTLKVHRSRCALALRHAALAATLFGAAACGRSDFESGVPGGSAVGVPWAPASAGQSGNGRALAEIRRSAEGFEYLAREVVVKLSPRATVEQALEVLAPLGPRLIREDGPLTTELGFHTFQVKGEADAAIEALSAAGLASSAERNYLKQFETTPNDPDLSRQWALSKIGAPSAWSVATGTPAIVVAILDTGASLAHPDLANNLALNDAEIAGNSHDDDGNGFVDDVRGWDAVDEDASPDDGHGHGSHVAGIVAAVGGNALGIAGVAYTARFLPVRVCGFTNCTTTDFVEGLLYALLRGARVANASLGGVHPPLSYERDAIVAFGAAGGTLVAAAGNSSSNNDATAVYPASYPLENIIAVAATGSSDELASFSNYGAKSVHLAAPGVDILSTYKSGWVPMSGTSMASPYVAGAVALLFSKLGPLPPVQARQALLESVEPVSGLAGRVASAGRLSLWRLLGAPCDPASSVCPPAPVDECRIETDDCSEYAECLDQPVGFACKCREGFTGDGRTCTPLDQCRLRPCDGNAECESELGSRTCTCRIGLEGDGESCADLDECASGSSRCPEGTSCSNLPGGFFCEGQTPVYPAPDVDECALGLDACDSNATCFNTNGSYSCICNPGWAGDGFFCRDINECTPSLNPCDAGATCENLDGGFECTCGSGYTGDGLECEDLDECATHIDRCDANAVCENQVGGYACACNAGFEGDGFRCRDVDECATGQHSCGDLGECVNQPGRASCRCKAGFEGDGYICEDVDECARGTDSCDKNARCENRFGSYECACLPGFVGVESICVDVDECAVGLADCDSEARCDNLPGAFRCTCKDGFEGDGRSCRDIDECVRGTDDCSIDASCLNTVGSFECSCHAGFSGNGRSCSDIDECSIEASVCDPNAECHNLPGSYRCQCDAGYEALGAACRDVDECSRGLDNCAEQALCSNLPGSFSCACASGWQGDGRVCTDIDECGNGWAHCGEGNSCKNTPGSYLCVCKPGHRSNGQSCVDINECQENLDDCHPDALCTNLDPGFVCACPAGYIGDGKTCTDVDECARNLDNCSPYAACKNTRGGFECTCNSGYSGDGKSCVEVNECQAGTDDCAAQATCTNLPGSFGCACLAGYQGDGKTCSDVDECAKGTHGCAASAQCSNTVGSYTCACLVGYQGDGKTCTDVNECLAKTHSCNSHSSCRNTPGSYACDCHAGYGGPACTDIDECQSGSHNCSPNATCANTNGAFTCSCRSGFEGDGRACTDIDECARGTDDCAAIAQCTNTVGAFKCACPALYSGDGRSCDRDQCAAGEHDCPTGSTCRDLPGGFECLCPPGFEGNGYSCSDTDECARGTHECDGECQNTVGDYACSCGPGFVSVGRRCLEKPNLILALDTSGDHTCAVTDTGLLRCFGFNAYGQLGLGHTHDIGDDEAADSAGYVDVGGPVVQVAAGIGHTCALLSNGSVRCFGRNEYGQLGLGHTRDVGDDELPAREPTVDLGSSAVALAAGGEHTCALLAGGQVRCWGLGVDGQLGYGDPDSIGDDESPSAAGDVALDGSAVALTAGRDHTCALLEDGAVRCWGRGSFGQLGLGTSVDVGDDESPLDVPPVELAESAAEIDAGWYHTCARLVSGKLRCWGYGGAGQLGILSDKNLGDNETPLAFAPIDLGATAERVSAGLHHTCAVVGGGNVSCWGYGADGRLGYANTQSVGLTMPPRAAGTVEIGGTALGISAGAAHSCALVSPGLVRCWGLADRGQLGTGSRQTVGDDETPIGTQPTLLADLDECKTGLNQCHAEALCTDELSGYSCNCREGFEGDGRFCADLDECELELDSCDEDAACTNTEGSYSCACRAGYAGDGLSCTDIDECATPNACGPNAFCENTQGSHLCRCAVGFVWDGLRCIEQGRYVVSVAAGGEHNCALLNDGKVRCWGNGSYGRLGYGNSITYGDDEPASSAGDVPLGGSALQVVAGGEHSCALLTGGGVRCWGRGTNGRLGTGSTASIGDDEPPSALPPVALGAPAKQIVAGSAHTCALLHDGSVSCWGSGSVGRLGYGNSADVGDNETPAAVGRVDLGAPVTALAAGQLHTCALLDSGNVRCWGLGQFGRLGTGNTQTIGDDEAPRGGANAAVGARALALAAGSAHTCVLLETGTVRCFGYGHYGQLGTGNRNSIGDDELPSSVGQVPLAQRAIQLTCGNEHSCALLDNGSVRCWGYGLDGQLGLGNPQNIGDDELPDGSDPIQLGGYAWAVSAGGRHTCALLTTEVRCFGLGTLGRLGLGHGNSIGDDEVPASAPSVPLLGP